MFKLCFIRITLIGIECLLNCVFVTYFLLYIINQLNHSFVVVTVDSEKQQVFYFFIK